MRFVRYRGGPTADIGRTGRQQQFIKALASEMFSTKAVLKLPQLLPEIVKNINTNIPMKDMLYLAEVARDFNQDKILTQTLPGYPFTDPNNGASYWVADEDIARGIVKDLFTGQEFDVAQDPPQSAAPQVKAAIPEEIPEQVNETEDQDNPTEGSEVIQEQNEEDTVPPEEPGETDINDPDVIITDPNELPSDLVEETEAVITP